MHLRIVEGIKGFDAENLYSHGDSSFTKDLIARQLREVKESLRESHLERQKNIIIHKLDKSIGRSRRDISEQRTQSNYMPLICCILFLIMLITRIFKSK